MTDNIVRGKGPTAVSSRLGYLLSGPFNSEPDVSRNIVVSVNSVESFDLERFWSVEQLGVETPEKDAHTIANKTDSLLVYQRTGLDFVNGQYIAKFPWKTKSSRVEIELFRQLKTHSFSRNEAG